MRKTLAVVIALAAASPASADFSSTANGTSTADFLNLGVGARAVAMGGAYAAAADDATALYWNPAGLALLEGGSATLMHAAYIASSYFDYAAAAHDLGRYGGIGAGVQYFSLGGLSQTDASGVDLGKSSPYDLAASIGYAYHFEETNTDLDGMSVGVVGKVIEEKIVTTATGFAGDVGIVTDPKLGGRLRIALMAQNIGTKMKFDSAHEQLPTTFKLGGAFRPSNRALLTLDLAVPRGGGPYANVGGEYQLVSDGPWRFAARAGYSSYTASSINGFTGVSMGFGLGYGGGSVDYAFVPFGGLGQAHRISLNLKF